MDNYEKLLEEKIENAKRDYSATHLQRKKVLKDVSYPMSKLNDVGKFDRKIILIAGQIEAYQDALNEYRQFKVKEGKQNEKANT